MRYYYAGVDVDGNCVLTLNSPIEYTDAQIQQDQVRLLELTEDLVQAKGKRFTGGPYPVGKTQIPDTAAVIDYAPDDGIHYRWTGTEWEDTTPPVTIGRVNTGRGGTNQQGPDDINPSFIEFYDGTYTQTQLELYVPTTSTLISYDSSLPYPYFFDSTGNCFNGTDYEVQIRVVATGQILGEITVPLLAKNRDVEFILYS